MNYTVAGVVGVIVDEAYPWNDSLLEQNPIARQDPEGFAACRTRIEVAYARTLNKSGCREVADGVWVSSKSFVSDEYGLRLSLPGQDHLLIETRQECNEWFMICLQAMLLRSDLTMVHAAAVCKDGKALLMPSWGGVGKTACVTRLVREQGWLLLGDDIVILQGSDVLAFPKDFVVYPYHRPLFPELFRQGKGPISPTAANRLMSKTAVAMKPILRRAPGLLSFARKHNPQSRKISPYEIFGAAGIGTRATLDRVVWLERTAEECEGGMHRASLESLASKTASVTLLEIVGSRLPSLCAMMGCGLLDYDEMFVKTAGLVKQAYCGSELWQLSVPTSVPVEDVPDWLMGRIGQPEQLDELTV